MKTCISCKESKSLDMFHKNKSKKDGLQNECKECCKLRDKKYYDKYGSSKYVENSKKNYERNKEFVRRYKQIFCQCIDCGIKDWRVLQFDHMNSKKHNISDMIYSNSINLIKQEIKKCVTRCANCHQIKTHHNE